MYNKSKHLIGMIGAICAIVLGGMILLSEVYNIVLMVKYDNTFKNWYFLYLFFSLIIRMIIGGMLLSFGMSSLGKPTLYTSAEFGSFWIYAPRGKTIGLIVLGSLKFVGALISVVTMLFVNTATSPYLQELARVDNIVQFLSIGLCLAIVVCKVISLLLKDTPVIAETQEEIAEEENA